MSEINPQDNTPDPLGHWLTQVPIAHRGLHDKSSGIHENSKSAILAAIIGGYAIEIDLQPSLDKVPMVFHDYELQRMTAIEGKIRERHSGELMAIPLLQSADTIWTLAELLETVDGKVGLVIELKGQKSTDDGFVAAVLTELQNYRGPYALMSFDHWLLDDIRKTSPQMPVGLVGEGGDEAYSTHKKAIDAYDPDFLSYDHHDLDCRFAAEFRDTGKPVICWTVKSPEDAAKAYRYADQITFEGFLPNADAVSAA